MFAIFESNGGEEIGLTCKEDGSGDSMQFDTRAEAESYAKENCAFDWQIISL